MTGQQVDVEIAIGQMPGDDLVKPFPKLLIRPNGGRNSRKIHMAGEDEMFPDPGTVGQQVVYLRQQDVPGDRFFQQGIDPGFETLKPDIKGVAGDQLDDGDVGVPGTGLDIAAKTVVAGGSIGNDQVHRMGFQDPDRLRCAFGKKYIGNVVEMTGQIVPFRLVGKHQQELMFSRRKRSFFTPQGRGNIQLAGNHVQTKGRKCFRPVQRYTGQELSYA